MQIVSLSGILYYVEVVAKLPKRENFSWPNYVRHTLDSNNYLFLLYRARLDFVNLNGRGIPCNYT